MAVSTTNAYSGPYTANGSTTSFPFTFSALASSDVAVLLRAADGTETVAGVDDYTVTFSGTVPSAGSVVFDTAPASGVQVLPYLDVPFTQQTAFADGSAWKAAAVNNTNDRSALRDQVLKRDVDRSLAVPLGEAGFAIPGTDARAEKALFFDADGNPDPISIDDFSAPALAAATSAEMFTLAIQLLGAGIIYDTDADGVASGTGVASGEYFVTWEDGRVRLYLNNAGSAVEKAEFATVAYFEETLALSPPSDNIRYYGYVADGTSNPLSGVTRFKGVNTTGWTLSQWQAAVPQVTALTNEIDAIAVQAFFNDRDEGGVCVLPVGTAVWDIGIQTGEDQHVAIKGSNRDLCRIKFTGTGTLWKHGFTGSVAASGTFTVRNITVVPAAVAACCFNVRFAGDQPVWCHIVQDVLIYPEDGTSYFINPTITRNIKRGLDWDRFHVYGRHFYTQSTPAHLFPPNVSGDADCPPDQAGTLAGNSYSIEDSMCIGYFDGWEWDFTGFDADDSHCHEEARMYGCEAYSGVGFCSIVNANTNYAPADNFLFEHCGWQGTGRAFDLENCEFVSCTNMLLVTDTSTASNHVMFANIVNCRDTLFTNNEMFSPTGSTNFTGFFVTGANTAGVEIKDNATVSYSTFNEWLYIAASCPASTVEERGNRFRGTGTYTNGKVVDASNVNISETRVNDIMAAFGSASASWDVRPNGDIVFTDVQAKTCDASGNLTLTLPTGLFRGVKSGLTGNNNNAWNYILQGSITTTSFPIQYAGVSSAQSLTTSFQVIGR